MGRVGRPEDLAGSAAFLVCKELSGFMTAFQILVAGGMVGTVLVLEEWESQKDETVVEISSLMCFAASSLPWKGIGVLQRRI